jgi:hypothetical protein
VEIAEDIEESRWRPLKRRVKRVVATEPRRRPENVKERIVREREYKNIRLVSEHVAEFSYRPGACKRSYRVAVLRKNLSVERGERMLYPDIRYFFYIGGNDSANTAFIISIAILGLLV